MPSGNAGSRPSRLAGARAASILSARLPAASGQLEGGLELAGAAGLLEQPWLEAAVGHPEHGDDDVAVGLAAQVGDPVLGDDDVAQLPRHRRVGVAPDDVGGRAPVRSPGAAHADDGAGALQRVGHGDEVVLAAGAADDAAVLELVGGHGAEQGRHHGGVDEAGVGPLRALGLGIAVERVGEGDGGHGDELERLARHLPQLAIEGLVADEEPGMQDRLAAVGGGDAAAQDAGAHQGEEPVDQHLGAAVEAGREGGELRIRRQAARPACRAEP